MVWVCSVRLGRPGDQVGETSPGWQTNHLSTSEADCTKNKPDLSNHQQVRTVLPAQATGFGIHTEHQTLKMSRLWRQDGSNALMGRNDEKVCLLITSDLQKGGFRLIQSQPRNISWAMTTLILAWDHPTPRLYQPAQPSSPHNWMSWCIAVGWATGGECSPPM